MFEKFTYIPNEPNEEAELVEKLISILSRNSDHGIIKKVESIHPTWSDEDFASRRIRVEFDRPISIDGNVNKDINDLGFTLNGFIFSGNSNYVFVDWEG